MRLSISSAAVLVAVLLAAPVWATIGPGLGNPAFSQSELFTPVGFIDSPGGHGNVTMVQGYLMVITSSDGGGRDTDGGVEFWDVSDPRAPTLAVRHENEDTFGLREAHGFSLSWTGDRLVLCAQAVEGIQFWDVTDPHDIQLLSYLDLPGITRGDYSGDWWVFWQAPWVYVAGVNSGLYVVDGTDPLDPVLVTRVATGQMAGVAPAQVFAVGNLLIAMEAQSRGMATLDISDPTAPRILRQRAGNPGYSHIFAADGKILTSGSIPPRVTVHQVSPTGAMDHVSTFALFFNSGGYGTWQDGFFHSGFSDRYAKFDIQAQSTVGTGSSGRARRDEDFAVALGNFVFAGDDHDVGTALIPHQLEPDTTPPVVQWLHPPDQSVRIAPTSRFGLSFSDHIDVNSLSDETVMLEDEAGVRIEVALSAQLGLVNVSPRAALAEGESVRLIVEGVRDLAGNASPRFAADFTVGTALVRLSPEEVVADLSTRSLLGSSAVRVFGEGVATYVDRDFTVQPGFPERLDGQPFLQTRNNDKLSVSADFLTFTLLQPATVVVLYDVRASQPPTWLGPYEDSGETVTTTDTTFRVHQQRLEAGPVVLGGNAASGSNNTESMYIVVLVPDTEPPPCSLALTPQDTSGPVALSVQTDSDARVDWRVGDVSLEDAPAQTTLTLPAGRHGVVATVSRGAFEAACSGVQVVYEPPTASPPRTSSPLLWVGGDLLVANSDHGTISRLRSDDGSRLYEVAVGAFPSSLAKDSSGRVWVTNRDDSTLSVLDPATGAVLATHPLPWACRPEAVVIDALDNLYVSASATGAVYRLRTDGTVLDTLPLFPTASGLGLHEDRLYVSRFISPDSGGEVAVVAVPAMTRTGTIALPLDPGPDAEDGGRGVPNYLSPLRIDHSGRRAYVAGKKDNIERGLFKDGQELSFESRVRAFIATIDLVAGEELVELRIDVNDRDQVQPTVPSPLGDLLFATATGGNTVDVFDPRTSLRVAQFHVGKAPMAQAFAPDQKTLAIHNALDRSVMFFDTSALLTGAANTVAAPVVANTVTAEVLLPAVLRGKQLFHHASDERMSKDGYISCASCHADGGHDGRTWDFTQAGEGLRNTITLHGRKGMGHGLVHWTANFDEIQDFENDIRGAFGGRGFLSDEDFEETREPLGAPKAGRSADLDALAAYVASLDRVPPSPHREGDGALTDAARRGRAVFLQADCHSCHGGAAFSDFTRHDVGTIGLGSGQGHGVTLAGVGFETPTLLGVWDTQPYLHDGSAATLTDAVLRHVPTPALSAEDLSDLSAYLLALDGSSGAPEADCTATNECVRVPGGNGEGEGEGEGEGDWHTPPGCSCGQGDPALAALLALVLLVPRRRRR
jgi:MYXO-CTERM domain-containing protein